MPLQRRRYAGSVKWFNNLKGYGFITPNDGGADVFLHCSCIQSVECIHLLPGTLVEYETVDNLDGKVRAINVTAPGGGLLQDNRKVGLGWFRTFARYSNNSSTIGSRSFGPCFYCGQWGHLSKNCYMVARGGAKSRVWQTGDLVQSSERFGLPWCYYCGSPGHAAFNCPHRRLHM